MTAQKTEALHPPPSSADSDEIDLRELVRLIWIKRRLIIGLMVTGSLAGVVASQMSTKYVSEGLFMTSAPVDAYKRYESILLNGPRLRQFLQQSDNTATTAALLPLADNPASLRKAIAPEFGFTDKDAKTFGVQAEKANDLIGIRLRHENDAPMVGTPVTVLAEFVRDTIIRVDLEAEMLSRCNDFRTREQTLRNDQIQNDFDIQQQQQRISTLKTLIARQPNSAMPDNRQIVAVEQGSERFLSPLAQLTAAEILVADMRLAEARRERERAASALKRDYYCQAQHALQTSGSGRSFLEQLQTIQAATFEGKNRTDDLVEKTWNELEVERTNWSSKYLSSMRFIASPDGSEIRQRKPGMATAALLGLILGGMGGILAALIAGWWHGSRREVVAEQGA